MVTATKAIIDTGTSLLDGSNTFVEGLPRQAGAPWTTGAANTLTVGTEVHNARAEGHAVTLSCLWRLPAFFALLLVARSPLGWEPNQATFSTSHVDTQNTGAHLVSSPVFQALDSRTPPMKKVVLAGHVHHGERSAARGGDSSVVRRVAPTLPEFFGASPLRVKLVVHGGLHKSVRVYPRVLVAQRNSCHCLSFLLKVFATAATRLSTSDDGAFVLVAEARRQLVHHVVLPKLD